MSLQQKEESLSAKFPTYQNLQQQKQKLEQEIFKHTNELKLQLQKNISRLENLQQQEQEVQQIVSNSAEVETALEKLQECRQRLSELDQLQHQVAPLLQRRYTLTREIEGRKARLTAKLEQLQEEQVKLFIEIDKVPEVRQEVLTVDSQIQELEKNKFINNELKKKAQKEKLVKNN